MIFQGCCFKNAGVAGYVEAFGIVQLENQASYIGYLFRNRCTRKEAVNTIIIAGRRTHWNSERYTGIYKG